MIDMMGAIGLGVAALSLIVAIAAVVVTYQVARRQERQQRDAQTRQYEAAERQTILTTCDTLVTHLTRWHDALRAVVLRDDEEALDQLIANIERFEGNAEFQGPLGRQLQRLAAYPSCTAAISAVESFERAALEFKHTSMASTLHDIVSGHGHWLTTKVEAPGKYLQELNEALESVRCGYDKAIAELNKLSDPQAPSNRVQDT